MACPAAGENPAIAAVRGVLSAAAAGPASQEASAALTVQGAAPALLEELVGAVVRPAWREASTGWAVPAAGLASWVADWAVRPALQAGLAVQVVGPASPEAERAVQPALQEVRGALVDAPASLEEPVEAAGPASQEARAAGEQAVGTALPAALQDARPEAGPAAAGDLRAAQEHRERFRGDGARVPRIFPPALAAAPQGCCSPGAGRRRKAPRATQWE